MLEFTTMLADPPWPYRDRLPPTKRGHSRGAGGHYPLMTIEDLCRFPLPPMAKDARLFLWRVAAEPEAAYRVARAWGFTPKAEIIWVKTTKPVEEDGLLQTIQGAKSKLPKVFFGLGRRVRYSHEVLVIAERGRPQLDARNVRTVIFAPRGRHSEKPEVFHHLIETLSPGPRVELFARAEREGWTCLGNELGC